MILCALRLVRHGQLSAQAREIQVLQHLSPGSDCESLRVGSRMVYGPCKVVRTLRSVAASVFRQAFIDLRQQSGEHFGLLGKFPGIGLLQLPEVLNLPADTGQLV